MTRYIVTSRRPDGEEHTGTIVTDGNWNSPEDLGRTYAESFGYEFVSVKEASMADDPVKNPTQKPDNQNKTAEERVDKQSIDTKQARPNKTGDVKPS